MVFANSDCSIRPNFFVLPKVHECIFFEQNIIDAEKNNNMKHCILLLLIKNLE